MYHPIPNGSVEQIENEGYTYDCQLPPEGHGKHRLTGEIKYIGVRSISNKQASQKWKPLTLPADWKVKRKKEIAKQKHDPEYFDTELEKIRDKFWLHRMCGEWIIINGKATYIPPSFWFYLTCSPLDVGLPNYRDTDRRFYYYWEFCCDDPRCGGGLDVERRRMGKTYKSGSIGLDRTSIFENHHCGIQSKTGPDAKNVFLKTVVNFFKKSFDFFRPVYDQSKGITPTTELRFFKTVVKGKRAEDMLEGDELESWCDWGSSDLFFYDGAKLNTYIMDEFAKTSEVDTWERWNVVRFCLDQDGEWCGKALLTSTVEEMEQGGSAGKKLWDASNPNERDKNGRTKSGLYRFFLPAFETTFFDEYGMPLIEKAKKYYLDQREGFANDSRALSSMIRKNPFSITEAFRIDGDLCLFDPELLNNQLDKLEWGDNFTTFGDLVWKDGKRDTEVLWVPNKKGAFEISWLLLAEMRNKVIKRGTKFYPNNKLAFTAGGDPYDFDQTVDSRRSNGTGFVKWKFDSNYAEDPLYKNYNDSLIIRYSNRPQTATIYYEEMIKMCFFAGCEFNAERNKIGLIRHFKERGYGAFLMWFPGEPEAGISSSPKTKQEMVEITEEHIINNIHKCFFKTLITQWLHFDITKTEKFDEAMGAGWCLTGDKRRIVKTDNAEAYNIEDFFPMHAINA